MKKVIVSAYACSPIRGSEPGNGWNWAINIASLGYEVWCLTNTEDKEIIEESHKKSGLINLHFVFVAINPALDKKLLDTSSKKIYLHYMLWRRKASSVAIQLHKEINFDIAHHVTFGSLQQGTFLWKLKNVKMIFGPVGGGQNALPAFKKYFGKEWKMEVGRNYVSKLMVKWNKNCYLALKKAFVVLVSNKETYELAIKSGGKNVKFFFDATLPENFYPGNYIARQENKKIKLLWTGRFLPRKALPLLFESLSKINADLDFSLTIVGDGPMADKVQQDIAFYNLKDKVQCVGWVPFEQVKQYYKDHDIFIFTSLRESGGVQLLEAMAYSLPIVTLDIHGASVLVPDNAGIKVPLTTPEETTKRIAEAIERLGKNYQQRQNMSENAYRFSLTQTWPLKVREVTNSYY